MSAVIVNVVIGLVTSVISGGCVWLWQRVKKTHILRRKAAFFGIHPGGDCLIVMNHKWNTPGSTHQKDVHAMIEIAALASELGARISVRSCDDIRETNSGRTEFCIGGAGSNPRTGGHLAAWVPGVAVTPFSATEPGSYAIVAGGHRFLYEPGKQEYALVAKFRPAISTSPIFVVSGQTAIANLGAVYLLKRDYRQLTRALASIDQFCLIVRITSPDIYGHEMAELAEDVSDIAFTRGEPQISAAEGSPHP